MPLPIIIVKDKAPLLFSITILRARSIILMDSTEETNIDANPQDSSEDNYYESDGSSAKPWKFTATCQKNDKPTNMNASRCGERYDSNRNLPFY